MYGLLFKMRPGNSFGRITQAIPAAPTGIGVNAISGTEIDITWTDNSDNETGFRIERRLGTEGEETYTEAGTAAAGIMIYNDFSLQPLTQYYYQVCAYNLSGNSSYTAEGFDTTSAANEGVWDTGNWDQCVWGD